MSEMKCVTPPVPWSEVTKTNFQQEKEKTLPTLGDLVLTYQGAPFIGHFCQEIWAVFKRGQVAEHQRDEVTPIVGRIEGQSD